MYLPSNLHSKHSEIFSYLFYVMIKSIFVCRWYATSFLLRQIYGHSTTGRETRRFRFYKPSKYYIMQLYLLKYYLNYDIIKFSIICGLLELFEHARLVSNHTGVHILTKFYSQHIFMTIFFSLGNRLLHNDPRPPRRRAATRRPPRHSCADKATNRQPSRCCFGKNNVSVFNRIERNKLS